MRDGVLLKTRWVRSLLRVLIALDTLCLWCAWFVNPDRHRWWPFADKTPKRGAVIDIMGLQSERATAIPIWHSVVYDESVDPENFAAWRLSYKDD